MLPGDVIAGRFELERPVAAGGMGRVYRAIDRLDGAPVALKVLLGPADEAAARFRQEVEILAAIRHPGIVRYVAHGTTRQGEPYLVMEWLEGITLSARLAAGPLSVTESAALARRLATALGALHRRGGVHRDLKPSNVFLVGGALEGATLIDFGIARLAGRSRPITLAGVMLGTPQYMAPEQIRAPEEVDARADVFALGCVLYRCLTGQAAFTSEDDLSVLLKVLLDEPRPARALRPDIPPALDDLLGRMLAKSPDRRPRDGDAVAEALARLGGDLPDAPASMPMSGLTSREKRVMSLVLTVDHIGNDEQTLSPGEDDMRRRALVEAVARHQGRVELVAERSLLAVLTSAGGMGAEPGLPGEPPSWTRAATDLAARSARAALAIAQLLPGAPIVVVTGRALLSERLPVGELIERAVAISTVAHRGGAAIRVDDVTAGLLDARFDVGVDEAGPFLRGEREVLEGQRTLLGKPTPCVGRDRELAMLEETFTRCAEEQAASAALVTAPAGAGKSRVLLELVRRLRARGPVEIWAGQGDPLRAGSPFGLLGQALRRAADLHGGEPIDERRRRLRARVGRRLGAGGDRVAGLLGEIAAVPFDDEASVELRAARRDPALMGELVRRAFVDFLRAECEAGPVVLALEDLHWSDLPTVKLVDAALRDLRDRPLLILGLARPEVHEAFPRLWAGRRVQEVRLAPLGRRASAALAREVLGPGAREELVQDLARRADGNAFYLEELIRAAADGKEARLPETVLAMVQARLEGLEPEARRILRAASVFGETFWQGGVEALIGKNDVEGWLAALRDDEVISPAPDARLAGEVAFAFRHALVREAAYGMLTEGDRAIGHRLAGEWLEQRGEGDAALLAAHFERGGARVRAAVWYRRAAEQAFEGNALDLACARAASALACAEGDGAIDARWTGDVYLLRARASRWRGEYREALAAGLEAMRRLPPRSARWCEAAGEASVAGGRAGDLEALAACSEALLAAEVEGEQASGALAIALAGAARTLLVYGGQGAAAARAEALLARAEEVARRAGGDPAVSGHLEGARSRLALVGGDVSGYLARMEASRASFERAGALRDAYIQAVNVGYALVELGVHDEAARVLAAVLVEIERMGLADVRATAKHNLGLALALGGRVEEGRAAEEEAAALAAALGNRRMEAGARIYLARILALAGDTARAAEEARAVSEDPATSPALRAYALAALARALGAEGRAGEARAAAEQAMAIVALVGAIEDGESLVRLTHAEALLAAREEAAARAAIAEARAHLLARAAKIGDPVLRESFLARVPENARTLDLARELGVGEGSERVDR